jgi:hypothetical protein
MRAPSEQPQARERGKGVPWGLARGAEHAGAGGVPTREGQAGKGQGRLPEGAPLTWEPGGKTGKGPGTAAKGRSARSTAKNAQLDQPSKKGKSQHQD